MAGYEDIFEKLPFDFEAEQSVLGAVLINPDCISELLDLIKADHFFKEHHQKIFEAMISMFSLGEPMDFITILKKVRDLGIFENDEQAKIYLTSLVSTVPTAKNVLTYARIVQEKYYVRSLMTVYKKIIDDCLKDGADAKVLLDSAEQKIMDIRDGRDSRGLVKMNEVMASTYDTLQKLNSERRNEFLGQSCGFSDVDRYISGLNKSDLIIIAARPAMGKTSFALNIAQYVGLKSDKAVAVFSLEMSREQLASRMLSSLASIDSKKLSRGTVAQEDWQNIAEAAGQLAMSNIYIDDTTGITVSEMRGRLRRVKNLGLVVIDYLQLMESGKRSDNRVAEVSEITRGLKILAKDLNVPVMVLSQLGRGPDQRKEDHRPLLSDLRDSGSIEQDADIVMFLYRGEYYKDDTTAKPKIAECIIGKNRHGEVGSVELMWEGEYTRFNSISKNIGEP